MVNRVGGGIDLVSRLATVTVVLLGYVVYDDPHSLRWVAGLLEVGVVLSLVQRLLGSREGPAGHEHGDPAAPVE